MSSTLTALRGAALTFTGNPFQQDVASAVRYEPDALVLMEQGRIIDFGDFQAMQAQLPPGTAVAHYRNALILPGFIDTHCHYPQTPIIGAYGRQLIDWLENYTFVAEQRFADPDFCAEVARLFLDECLRSGTTTAMVYCTVHAASVEAFFAAAVQRNMRMIAGKVLMDRNAPAALCDTPQRGYDESKALLRRWHGRDRQHYAITPRFAPSSSPEQLAMAGALWREFPEVYLQSHVSENVAEVAWAKSLFPGREGYLDIYNHYGLLGPRAVYGHGIHLEESERGLCHATGTAIAHCPTSNFFLGSGALDVAGLQRSDRPVHVGLASDIGAGTSFSALQSMNAAYKAAQLHGYALSAWQAFYLATRGAAEALYLQDCIGSIAPGQDADLVVLDLQATPLIEFRMRFCESLEQMLFVLMTLGDDRATRATYVAGRCAYTRDHAPAVG